MCSVFPNSDKVNIYRKLVAARIPRTTNRSSAAPRHAPTPRVAWCSSKKTSNSSVNNKRSCSPRHCNAGPADDQVKVHHNSNPSIALEIRIQSYRRSSNCPGAEISSSEKTRQENSYWTKSSQSEYSNPELYDDDMISVWSTFDLKSYDLDCRDNNTNSRAKSAPPRRQTYNCGNAALLYNESRGSSQCSRRNKNQEKLNRVLAETTPKLIKSVHLDYDLYLQALKLEKCVPANVSDKRIRQDIDRIFKKHNKLIASSK
ncbi:hypothetical protein ACHWQZ_G001039 [Mnemiopsis leidyi]